jgi:hypothetical protein
MAAEVNSLRYCGLLTIKHLLRRKKIKKESCCFLKRRVCGGHMKEIQLRHRHTLLFIFLLVHRWAYLKEKETAQRSTGRSQELILFVRALGIVFQHSMVLQEPAGTPTRPYSFTDRRFQRSQRVCL